jgi:hypothetical protein
MATTLDLDLHKLKPRAYNRAEWAEDVLRRYHAATGSLGGAGAQQLRGLYNWMFVPPTLWPFNIQDVLAKPQRGDMFVVTPHPTTQSSPVGAACAAAGNPMPPLRGLKQFFEMRVL